MISYHTMRYTCHEKDHRLTTHQCEMDVRNYCLKMTAVELSESVANARLRTKHVWFMSK